MNSIEKFSNRAEYYYKYRPTYPVEVVDQIISQFKLTSDSIVADIASGTGIFTSLFNNKIKTIYGIEPNNEMSQYSKIYLSKQKNFIPINATYDNTSLQDSSVNAIVCAQAFHWFDIDKAKKEFSRITDLNKYCALIWNVRNTENPFFADYENILFLNIENYKFASHNKNFDKICEIFFKSFKKVIFDNLLEYDFTAICGLLNSSSYIPLEGKIHDKIFEEIKILFDKFKENDKVKLYYKTILYLGVL